MPSFEREHYRPTPADLDTWQDVASWPDPIQPHWERFAEQLQTLPAFQPSDLTHDDYLKVIAGNVDYFRQYQNDRGAIIDPYHNVEIQYSTPCFALAAATLVAHTGSADLLESAALAMDWATITLSERRAATAHEDFFPPQIGHALSLLRPFVAPERYAQWEQNIRVFDPYTTYRASPGGNNWNVVALSGEGLFYQLGLRSDTAYIESSLAAQGRFFNSHWGLYTEGPMAYDHFPRIWVADLLSTGFKARNTDKLAEVLRRGALTSLFMQSPTGELPTGGRSAHHQWNEAEQCVTYEIFAAKAHKEGDVVTAGVFKRGAHLALGSIMRWVRPSGELWIVKNRSDPAIRHGYESYSSHSQYNLLAVAMLSIAYKHAEATQEVPEQPTPADLGGFVIQLPEPFNKVIANAGGTQVLIDTNADLAYNPTGLLRIHTSDNDPQIGPSDGLSEYSAYHRPDGPRTTAAVGVAWQDSTGQWRRLADNGRFHHDITGLSAPLSATIEVTEQSPQSTVFDISYSGHFDGPERIIEHYSITPKLVVLSIELINHVGPTCMVWPVLAHDGEKELQLLISNQQIVITTARGLQSFSPIGSDSLRLEQPLYACRNGWSRLAVAEFSPGEVPELLISPSIK